MQASRRWARDPQNIHDFSRGLTIQGILFPSFLCETLCLERVWRGQLHYSSHKNLAATHCSGIPRRSNLTPRLVASNTGRGQCRRAWGNQKDKCVPAGSYAAQLLGVGAECKTEFNWCQTTWSCTWLGQRRLQLQHARRRKQRSTASKIRLQKISRLSTVGRFSSGRRIWTQVLL